MYTDNLTKAGETPQLRAFTDRDHPNAVKLKEAHESFQQGNLEKLFQLFADDMVWTVPGNNQLSGTFHGQAEIEENFKTLGSVVDSYWAYPLDYFGSDHHVALVALVRATRGDQTLEERECLLFTVNEEGRFKECFHLGLDDKKWDEFFA
ncbi:MAG: nuclear transport factor 2 family protein [Pseudomonadota bacterium]